MAGRGGRVPITKKRNKASLLLFCVVHLMIFDRKMIKFSAHRVCIQIQSLQPQLGVSSGGKNQGITSPGEVSLIWVSKHILPSSLLFSQSVSQSVCIDIIMIYI